MTERLDHPVVVGAGMAGLMLAATLERHGRPCTVLERTSSLDEVGAGVQLSPRSVQLLRQTGVISAVLERAGAVLAREIRDWRGHVLSTTELGTSCEERYGAPYLVLHRADLQQALLGAVSDDTVRLNAQVAQVAQLDAAVTLRTADGHELTAPAVIGADGIRSLVRESLVPDTPVASGYSAYRTLLPAVALPPEAVEPVVRIWVGPGQHTVTYPLRGGELLNVVSILPRAGGQENWTAPARVDELLAAHLGWDPLLTTILAQTGAATAWALHDREVLDRLAVARVALIGDAAHPMLPFAAQGVNQGIEDAWVLARCLLAPGDADLVARFAAYSRSRAPQAAQAQLASRQLAASLHVPDGPQRAARDASIAAGSPLSEQDSLLAPLGWHPPA